MPEWLNGTVSKTVVLERASRVRISPPPHMKILSIETSCDETAVAILECNGEFENPSFKILGNSLLSQIEIHKEYGGVFPSLAKREHAKNLIPLLENTLKQSNLYLEASLPSKKINPVKSDKVGAKQFNRVKEIDLLVHAKKILEREPGLFENLEELLSKIEIPEIDVIAVTYGPGLEPALWVGLNFAKALSVVWNKPLIPVNHMEGHILSVLLNRKEITNTKLQTPNKSQIKNSKNKQQTIKQLRNKTMKIEFPAIALLISGGHTELVLIKDWLDYEIIGQTKDDAVGEAFDKVARMLELPYPGGPEISKLAEETRNKNYENKWNLPRPMINTDNFDFSFSGLKTSVLYKIKKLPELTEEVKKTIAREFEDAVVDVLVLKTKKALQKYNAKTLIIGGGVVANKQIRLAFSDLVTELPNTKLLLPNNSLSTDNAIMIGIAGYFRFLNKPQLTNSVVNGVNKKTRNPLELRAEGNLRL